MFFQANQTDSLQKENLNLDIYSDPRNVPLGILLQKAGLISAGEIEVALEDQKHHSNLKFGQILATRGWVKQETADFFAREWHSMILEVKRGEAKYRLGESLEKAGLLNALQIQEILDLQKTTNKCFGQIAVEQGYIKEKTLNLFMKNLCSYNHKYLNETVESIVNSAKKFVKIQNYSLAILELRKALKYNPHHAEVHGLLSIIYIKQKQLTMANIHLKKAERTNPNEPLLFEAKSLLTVKQRFDLHHNQLNQNQETNNNPNPQKSGFFGLFNKKLAVA